MAGVGIIATSGMKAAMTNMEEISNNIANVNTIGFKRATVNFADLHSGSMTSNTGGGNGVKVSTIAQDFSGGRIETTDRGLDVSLAGDGFFVQRDIGSGRTSYTRAGRFEINKDGYLLGLTGRIQGFPALNGKVNMTGRLVDMKVPGDPIPATPTKTVNLAMNVNASTEIPASAFDITKPETYNFRTDTTIYDSLGNPNSLTVFYAKTANNNWGANIFVNDVGLGSGVIAFKPDGTLDDTTGLNSLSFSPAFGATTPQVFSLNFSGTTQFNGDNQVRTNNQDGNTAGDSVGFNIDNNGRINVYYSNGESQVAGQLAVAKFQSPQNLVRSEGMAWLGTAASGEPIIDPTSSDGVFNTGTVELSNVDLTEELVKLLGAQHDFQANAQVQQTYSQVLQVIENL